MANQAVSENSLTTTISETTDPTGPISHKTIAVGRLLMSVLNGRTVTALAASMVLRLFAAVSGGLLSVLPGNPIGQVGRDGVR